MLTALMIAILLLPREDAHADGQVRAVRISTFAFVANSAASIRGTPVVDRVIDEGWLERELGKRGVSLEWYPVTGDTGAVTNEAFTAGRIDFANIGDLPSVILNAGGVRTAVVVPNGRGGDMFLLVPAASTITSIRALKGKRISVHRGRPWELGLRKLIESEGLTPSDFRIFNLDPKAGAAALAAGKVDAHFANNGHLLEDARAGRIIWSSKGASPRFKFRAEIWGRRDFIERHPELTQLVATAFVRAAHWTSLEANREEVIRISMRNGTPENVVRRNFEDPALSWKDRWSPLFDAPVLAHYADVARAAKRDKLVRVDIDAREMLEPRFVEAALKDLGLNGHWSPWRPGQIASD